jgi:basic membrane protein A
VKSLSKILALVGCAALVLVAVLAVGASASKKSAPAHAAATFSVGVVADIGGLNDHGFNHLAYQGLLRAEKQLHVKGKVLLSKSGADYLPNLTSFTQGGYNMIIPVGFLMGNATATVAKTSSKTKFAMVDSDATTLKGKPKNVEGLLFKEQEAGYLVGYLAGLYAKDKKFTTISSVGGQKIPPVDHYIAGYQAGAKAADPGIKTLNAYSQDFVAQDKCKELALNQIAKGSKVVFQVAGQCGLGALDAAKQKNIQGIGVDADQSFLGKFILTSALKKVDVAVFNSIKAAMTNKFSGGKNVINSVANGAVGYGKIGPAGAKYAKKIAAIQAQIKSGKIKNIPDTVK